MIVVQLLGGLGNQMFQYAFARSLSLYYNTSLFYDTKDLSHQNTLHIRRHYALHIFDIKAELLNKSIAIHSSNKLFLIKRMMNTISGKKDLQLISEQKLYYDFQMPFPKNNCYLQGYWQSPKYFENIEQIIREDFKFKHQLSSKALETLLLIKNSNSVFIHIRRGDYAQNPETMAYHGLCDLSYYNDAIKVMSEKVKSPTFFIFSDDAIWVEEKFKCSYPSILVCKNNFAPEEDLQLMSQCKHAIVANSSFSWWGAWLVENKDKFVIAPKKWILNSNMNTDGLFPFSWTRL